MKRCTLLRQLVDAVNDLHSTTNNFALDQKSHKRNIDKNKVTRAHWERFVACTRRVLELLPQAREEVQRNPTRQTLRRLATCERQARFLIEPYGEFNALLSAATTNH